MRSGKRLPDKVSEIVIQYRPPPLSIFPPDAAEWSPQPEECMQLVMMTNDASPGGLRLSPTALDIRFERRSACASPTPTSGC